MVKATTTRIDRGHVHLSMKNFAVETACNAAKVRRREWQPANMAIFNGSAASHVNQIQRHPETQRSPCRVSQKNG